MNDDLGSLFQSESMSRGAERMLSLLNDPEVSQITCDRYDRIIFVDNSGPKQAENAFISEADYIAWVNQLLTLTDVGYTDVSTARTAVIEGSFRPDRIQVHGSIHVCTSELTRGEPAVTIRKQPNTTITLDNMLEQQMMSPDMRQFLELAIRGRSNILLSGGSGAGKTTMARALSYFIDPWQRVITAEEIDELHLYDRLFNCVSLTTFRVRDEEGRLVRETTLEDLVRESLRMRGDRVWVGETRGKEAYALVKACNSGHDGSVTTIHADSGKQAVKQAVTYVMESGLTEQPAREQVAQAFDLVIQLNKVKMGRRVITEISELEPVMEGNNQQRVNTLWRYDQASEQFVKQGDPTPTFVRKWQRYGVNLPNAGALIGRR